MGRVLTRLLAVVLLISACSGSPSAPGDEVVLRVLMADDWAARPPILDAVRQFESSHPGVRIDIVGRPFGQIMDEVASATAAGRPLDVVQEHAFSAGARGLAEPLDDWWAEQDESEWFPGAIADVSWGDSRYGVPLDINALFQISNAAIVDQPPASFAELAALATSLQREGVNSMTVTSNNWQVYGWIRANGGEIVEIGPDGSPTFTLDRAENIQALAFLADLVAQDLAYGPTLRDIPTDPLGLFANQQTALLVSGTWDTAALQENHPDLRIQTTEMPGGVDGTTSGSVLGGSSVFIGRGSEHRELALELIKAITTDETAIAMAELDGRLPPKPGLFARAGLDGPVFAGVTEQLQSAHPQRLIAFPDAQTAYEAAVDDALTGRVPAGQALRAAQAIAEGR